MTTIFENIPRRSSIYSVVYFFFEETVDANCKILAISGELSSFTSLIDSESFLSVFISRIKFITSLNNVAYSRINIK